ncbi:MAG: peptidylprolyl isomerase [Phycisphaerae bacterium]|nr:peptidylprolyl isomerase [Phycisphaerae bacterium]
MNSRKLLAGSAIIALVVAALALQSAVGAAPTDAELVKKIDPNKNYFPVLRAQIVPTQKFYYVGQPLLVDFLILNTSEEPALLAAPYQAAPAGDLAEKHVAAGLPLEHIFSRKALNENVKGRRALVVNTFNDPLNEMDNDVVYAASGPIDPIVIRPNGSVGRRVDLAKFYPSLTKPGRYIIQWRPYSDALRSLTTEIRVMAQEKATIQTTMGNMEVVFFYDKAPNHVENFLDLARRGFYDGTLFHRVIEDFMIQAGDPLTTDPAKEAQWGTGRGPRTLKQEFNDTPFAPGTLGAARGPDPDSASCQFYIVTGQAMHLNGKYTAFGQIVGAESQKTADKISKVRRNAKDRPLEPIKINKIVVTELKAATQPDTQPER